MKNNTLNPTIVFLAGLAFGLQKICRIIPEVSPNLRIYLFPLSSRCAKKNLEKLMQHALKFSAMYQSPATKCVSEYLEHPLRESECVKKDASSYFTTQRIYLHEDSFDHDGLNAEGLILGRTVYDENKLFFDNLIIDLYHKHPLTEPGENFGLLFVQVDD